MTYINRPTLAEAIVLQRDGKGVLSVEQRRIAWRYTDENGFGITVWFPGTYSSNDKARAAIAAARARVHLGTEAA